MTKNRRLKSEIRAQQAGTGAPYLVARRQITDPAATPPPANAGSTAAADQVTVHPPLAAWATPKHCRFLAELQEEHGPLMALRISPGDGWWDLDDLAREVAGALQDRPSAERGFWLGYGKFTITKREHLSGIAAKLADAGALPRLVVRALPDAANCAHASCRRRRGEPARPAGRPEPSATERGPRRGRPIAAAAALLSLEEVMAREPRLSDFGFGVFDERKLTVEQRREQLQREREDLRRREEMVGRVGAWLLANIAPIKTPTTGSYGMKHVVEEAIGEYITNGELIAAALMAGYPMSRPYGPNVDFGMSKRDVDAARKTR